MPVTFTDLGIAQSLVQTLQELKIVAPTPVQEQAIPEILAAKDVLAAAQTGTGKTAAFGLPIIQRLSSLSSNGHPKALILVPTRELAQQVLDNLVQYSVNTSLSIMCVYGGTSHSVQKAKLAAGCDILIATPGRLLDHAFNANVNLTHVSTLVLDEADRLLSLGFYNVQRKLTTA